MYVLALLVPAFAEPPQNWTTLDEQAWGSRPAPDPSVQAEMLVRAADLVEQGELYRALAQVQEARCRTDPACAAAAAEVATAVMRAELARVASQADPASSFGLYSTWMQWPLTEAGHTDLQHHYTTATANTDPDTSVTVLDDLALELPKDHPLHERLRAHFEAAAEEAQTPGVAALLAAASARYTDDSPALDLPYPSHMGFRLHPSACADLLGEDASGDLVAELALDVSRCETTTDVWSEDEAYEYEDVEYYEVWEEVQIGSKEECHERPYYDDNNILKEGWTETVCEDVPITEMQQLQRSRPVTRAGVRTVEHRRYSVHFDASLSGVLEDELGQVAATAPLSWSFSQEDHAFDAPGGSRSWDPELSEASTRATAASPLRGQILEAVAALDQAYAQHLVDQASGRSEAEADELLVRAWWWNRHVEPVDGPVWAAMTVVERSTAVQDVAYAIGPLPEADLIVDGYGRLHDARSQSGWIVKSPGLLKVSNSGRTIGLDLRGSYLGPGWAQTVRLESRGGGSSEYGGAATFAGSVYGGVSTQLDSVDDAAASVAPLGWFAGFSTGGAKGLPDQQRGWVLKFRLEYEAQDDPEGGLGYRNLASVFPDLLLVVPGTRWKLGVYTEVKWNWLGLQDPKKREAGDPLEHHHFTPMTVGPALALGPVHLKGSATWLAFRPEPVRFGLATDLVF